MIPVSHMISRVADTYFSFFTSCNKNSSQCLSQLVTCERFRSVTLVSAQPSSRDAKAERWAWSAPCCSVWESEIRGVRTEETQNCTPVDTPDPLLLHSQGGTTCMTTWWPLTSVLGQYSERRPQLTGEWTGVGVSDAGRMVHVLHVY